MKNEDQPRETEIQKADPTARKQALLAASAAVIAVGACILAVQLNQERITQWIAEHGVELVGNPELLFLAAAILALPLVGAAVYIFRLASRVVEAERIPLPGQKVIKDTPIITGRKAVRQGRGMQLVAILMGIIGLAFPFTLVLLITILHGGS